MTTTWIWGDLDDMIFADSDWEVSQREGIPMRKPRESVVICFFMCVFRQKTPPAHRSQRLIPAQQR